MKKSFYSFLFLRRNKNTMSRLVCGFTLVEALIAISILMIAIATPISLSQKALSSATLSRDQMTASFLAQDGLEAVKNLRDQIAIRYDSSNPNTDWLSSFRDKCICIIDRQCNLDLLEAVYCNINSTSDDLSANNSIIGSANNDSSINPLKIEKDSNNNFIKYDLNPAGSLSKFSRYINIATTTDPNEAMVQVRVCWPDYPCSQNSQKIDIKNFIYNLKKEIWVCPHTNFGFAFRRFRKI